MPFFVAIALVTDIFDRYKGRSATESTLTDIDVRVRVIRPEQGAVHIFGHAWVRKRGVSKSEDRLMRQLVS
ncbi:hypothetical protein GCM10010913_20450 [Paenibacillus aceti]|uniref:Uncharacterized protein n=1 Tax=Paenibacillus aceti TaxID=1820010 RepID=A0ABQ1VTP4_9BACL|nr:hypothetical protein GCM10010913_20450 [Paenibacillus aceti]